MKLALHMFSVVLISSLVFEPFAQCQAKHSDTEREGLLGPIRTVVEEWAYLSGDRDRPVEGSRYRDQSETYDRQGNLVERILYGGPAGTEVIERTLCSYDPEGHRLERTYSSEGIHRSSIKESDISTGGRSAEGAFVTKTGFVYDAQGKLIEQAFYKGSGELVFKEVYKYDAKHRLIETSDQTASGVGAKVTYSYHDDGRFPANEIGKDGRKVSYSYEFDSQGNWIKRVGLFESTSRNIGKTDYRTISYFGSGAAADELPKSDSVTTYYLVPAGVVKDVPYEVVAGSINPSVPPAPGVVEKRGVIVRGQAITRVQPDYPAAARLAHVAGSVQVEIVVDEEGNVIYSHVTTGHPLLRESAESAARRWKFSPTTIDGKPVKVLGSITLNFKQ